MKGKDPVMASRFVAVAALIFVGCATGRTSDDSAPDEEAVYAAVLDSLFVKSSGPIVVRRHTSSNISRERLVEEYWDALGKVPGVTSAMVADFEKRNASPRALTDLPTVRVRVLFAEAATLDSLPRRSDIPQPRGSPIVPNYWSALRERFDGARVLVTLTRPGFSRDGTEAVLDVGYRCGHLCGTGHIVTLRRSRTGWTVVNMQTTWIS